MPRRHLHVRTAGTAAIDRELVALRARLEIPEDWPPAVLAEAEAAARSPRLPAEDATDIPFFTLDPPDSRDLDQAMHLERLPDGRGFRVHYAIADVAAFVAPGGEIDAEARRRVQTLYFPDRRIPLHPPVLSEGAASLLPDQDRPALLWQLDLDPEGELTATRVRRALVRSRAKLDYAGAQRQLDAGTAPEALALLGVIGPLREQRERDRGGVSLPVPEQEVEEVPGGYALAFRAPRPADGWNAQISLLTGMAAARLMLDAGVGILRTLPAAPASAFDRLRRVAQALGVPWPRSLPYPELIRSLDPDNPAHAAFLNECTGLLRGAGYTAFDGTPPADPGHAAVAAPYAHCTAPLRRLVDRFAGEICLAVNSDAPVPEWVRAALPELPKVMEAGDRRAHEVDRTAVDLVEAALLTGREGELFDGVVVDVDERRPSRGLVQLANPAVRARISDGRVAAPPLPLGEAIRVRFMGLDPTGRQVSFEPA